MEDLRNLSDMVILCKDTKTALYDGHNKPKANLELD